jgi:hypothetical protein
VRRILMLVTVAVVMAALVALASPAFAAPGGQSDNEPRANPRETGGTPSESDRALSEKAPPTVPPGTFKRPDKVVPKGKQVFTGPI